MVMTRREKLANATASRLRFSGFNAKRFGTKVKVFKISDNDWIKFTSFHSKDPLLKSVSVQRIR